MSGGPAELRDFRQEDQPAVRALVEAGLAERWGTLRVDVNGDLDDIAAGRTVVAWVDGEIVGTGSILPLGDAAEIRRMSVIAGARGSGLGRQILAELVDTAREWGAERVVLETSTGWPDAIAFYRSCGFAVTHHVDGELGSDTWFELPLVTGA